MKTHFNLTWCLRHTIALVLFVLAPRYVLHSQTCDNMATHYGRMLLGPTHTWGINFDYLPTTMTESGFRDAVQSAVSYWLDVINFNGPVIGFEERSFASAEVKIRFDAALLESDTCATSSTGRIDINPRWQWTNSNIISTLKHELGHIFLGGGHYGPGLMHQPGGICTSSLPDLWQCEIDRVRVLYSPFPVTISNKISGGNVSGSTLTLKLLPNGNDDVVQSGSSRDLYEGGTYMGKTNHERLEGKKHNDWNNIESQYHLQENFSPDILDPYRDANFESILPATFQSRVIEGSSYNAGEFRDPWYLHSDPISPQPNTFFPYTAPFSPTGAYNQSSGGIFLGQIVEPNKPYYSVRVANPIYINSLEYRVTWDYNTSKATLTSESAPGYSQQAIVFNQSDAVITARYKAYQASSTTNATANNNQRKMVAHTLGGTTTYYQVYESGGDIWLSSSTGGTWANEILVSDGSGNNHNPSLDVYNVGSSNIYANIVWVNTSNATVYFRQRHWYSGAWSWLNTENVSSGDPGTGYNPSLWTPVIATNYIAYNRYHNGGGSGSIVVKDRQSQNFFVNAGSAPSSNVFCYNPSLAYYYPYGHIAYENAQSGTIYYAKVTYLGGYNYSWSSLERVSPSDWSNNSNPSLTIVYSGTPAVAWRNENNAVESGSSVCVRMGINVSGGQWQNSIQSYSYGYTTDIRPTLGGKTNNYDMSVVWSNNGTVTRGNYKNSVWSSPTVIGSGSNGGTHPNVTARVVNGCEPKVVFRKPNWQLSVLRAEAPEASVKPGPDPIPIAMSIASEDTVLNYRWNRHGLVDFGLAVGELEMQGAKTTTPPAGTMAFEVAEMTYGSTVIGHRPVVDTGLAAAQYRSDPFKVTDGSQKLTVSTAIYGLNLSVPQELLSQPLGPLARVTIHDAETDAILKVVSEIPASDLSKTQDYTFGSYAEFQADMQKLEGKEVYVGVSMLGKSHNVNPVIVDDYYITDVPSSKPGLRLAEKSEELTVPSKFALHQNFPNPFNPVTEISFDLPSKEHVTLTVFDVLGKKVMNAIAGEYSAGRHFVSLDFSKLPSGTYMYRLTAGTFADTKRLVLIK